MLSKMTSYSVATVSRSECEPFIIGIHYAKRWPSISYAFGLFRDGCLCGVVTYGRPASRHMQVGALPDDPNRVIELNRLCLTDNLKNEASILVSRSLKMLPPLVVISYADSKHGHKGYVYRASNFHYAGWTDMDRKTARLDYVTEGKHSRASFRSGKGSESKKVRRLPKAKYWTTTGNKRERKALEEDCSLPIISWTEFPPPDEHIMIKLPSGV